MWDGHRTEGLVGRSAAGMSCVCFSVFGKWTQPRNGEAKTNQEIGNSRFTCCTASHFWFLYLATLNRRQYKLTGNVSVILNILLSLMKHVVLNYIFKLLLVDVEGSCFNKQTWLIWGKWNLTNNNFKYLLRQLCIYICHSGLTLKCQCVSLASREKSIR